MTINSKVKGLLSGQITKNGTAIPVDFLNYTGEIEDYIVFRTSEDAAFWAGDSVEDSEIRVVVSIFTKTNYLTILQQIKEKMTDGGFMWRADSEDMYDTETAFYEKAAEFVIERSDL